MHPLPGRRDSRRWTIYVCPNPKCDVLLARPDSISPVECWHQHALPGDPPAWMERVEVVPAVPDGEAVERVARVMVARYGAQDSEETREQAAVLARAALGGEG